MGIRPVYRFARACTQRLSLEPEDSHDNHPGGVEGGGAFVVAGGEGAVLFAASDEVLDQVATTVGGAIEGASMILSAELGDGLADAASAQGHTLAAAGISFVAHGPIGPQPWPATPRPTDRPAVHEQSEDGRLVLLPRCQDDGQRLAVSLSLEMDLGREAALALAQRLRRRIPPFAPAACRWARITLPSTNWTPQSTCPAASSACWIAANTRSQIPASRQRQNRLYTVDHGPYRSGRSRQGAPVRSRQRMPLMIRRWPAFGRPVSGRSAGKCGFRRAHSWSVSSPRYLIPIVEQIPAHLPGRFAYRP